LYNSEVAHKALLVSVNSDIIMRKRIVLSILMMAFSSLVFWLAQPSLITSFLTSLLFWGELFILTYTLIGNIFVKNRIFYTTL
jgi:hypothetical protein